MRGCSVLLCGTLLAILALNSDAAKCRPRFMEMRGGDGFVRRGGCRGLDSAISEEYWTTIGYDGQLRDGRTMDDFMTFPVEENNGHQLRNSFVAYWITRSKYGDNRHYEAFGHAFVKPDGRVCGWFVGMEHEVVEVCGGFRILSRSRRNPHEQNPFEWVQGPQYRNRDTLGFHHHRIAKYELNPDEIFFGDAEIKGKKFQGVSPASEKFIEVSSPNDFHQKVWLLKKKSVGFPSEIRPANIISQKRDQDVDIYNDPHHESRIARLRKYPYYDQYGRSSVDTNNVNRQIYDAYGRRITNDNNQQQSENIRQIELNDPNPGQTHADYPMWLRRQYALRGQIPRGGDPGYEEYYRRQQVQNNNVYGLDGQGQYPQMTLNNPISYDVRTPGEPGYQRPMIYVDNKEGQNGGQDGRDGGQGGYDIRSGVKRVGNQDGYEDGTGGVRKDEGRNERGERDGGEGMGGQQQQQQLDDNQPGQTIYEVQDKEGMRMDKEGRRLYENGGDRDGSIFIPYNPSTRIEQPEIVIPSNSGPHHRLRKVRPNTIFRDQNGNIYEKNVRDGKIYIKTFNNGKKIEIDIASKQYLEAKIEKELEARRRQHPSDGEEDTNEIVENPPKLPSPPAVVQESDDSFYL